MKVFVEGIRWVGMWSEWIVDALQSLGHETDLFYCNDKPASVRAVSKVNKLLPVTRSLFDWEKMQQERLNEQLGLKAYDLLFSVQGKLDSAQVAAIRAAHPQMRIVYWLGDFMGEPTLRRCQLLLEAGRAGQVDVMLVSYRSVADWLTERGFRNVVFFPFGASPTWHHPGEITAADRERFGCDVSFVGSYYPERAEILSALNHRLARPVQVWGRGWQGSGVRSSGSLDLADCLKVYACSKISLNIQHHLTAGGFNIKYYEIPAAGGFQICDGAAEVENTVYAGLMPTFTDVDDLLAKIDYFLAEEGERVELAQRMHRLTWDECNYVDKVRKLLQALCPEAA